MLSQRSFISRGFLARLAQFPPIDFCVLCFRSVYMYIFIQIYKQSVFRLSSVCRLRPSLMPVLSLPSACVPRSIAASLAPFSIVSCRCFPVGLPPLVRPFHVASAVRSFVRRLLACAGHRPGLL